MDELRADVAVVGAGPAGIAAAVRAAESGRRVVLLDQTARPGGQIWRHGDATDLPAPARRWMGRLRASGAELVGGATVIDAAPGLLLCDRGGAPLRVVAPALVLATGARERFLPFPGWTLPGVLGVGGVQALLRSGAELRGRRAVVAGSGPLLLAVAAALSAAGATVAAVIEQADRARVARFAAGLWRAPHRLLQAARYRAAFRGAPYRPGAWVVRAEGDGAVRGATLTDGRRRWTERCDFLCVGYGLVPATELPRLLGCALHAGSVSVDPDQRTTVPGVWCAGEPTGIGGVDAALVEGEIAGLAAAGAPVPGALRARRDRERTLATRLADAFALRGELRALPDAGTVVCRCEDVRYGQLQPAWGSRAGKLITRAGMGPCQGRVCGPALDFLLGWEPDSVRPPLFPCSASTLSEPADAAK